MAHQGRIGDSAVVAGYDLAKDVASARGVHLPMIAAANPE